MATTTSKARRINATLVKNEPGRRPKYNVDDEGIVGSLYLEPNGEDEAREVPEEMAFQLPASAFA